MAKRRDRHDRGLRGPLAAPNPATGEALALRRPTTRADVFIDSVEWSVARVNTTCPDALVGIEVGIEDVPSLSRVTDDRIPLAQAIETTFDRPARIVLFRRPLEHRSNSRPSLRALVHRTLVEQLSALTGRSVESIDPAVDDD